MGNKCCRPEKGTKEAPLDLAVTRAESRYNRTPWQNPYENVQGLASSGSAPAQSPESGSGGFQSSMKTKSTGTTNIQSPAALASMTTDGMAAGSGSDWLQPMIKPPSHFSPGEAPTEQQGVAATAAPSEIPPGINVNFVSPATVRQQQEVPTQRVASTLNRPRQGMTTLNRNTSEGGGGLLQGFQTIMPDLTAASPGDNESLYQTVLDEYCGGGAAAPSAPSTPAPANWAVQGKLGDTIYGPPKQVKEGQKGRVATFEPESFSPSAFDHDYNRRDAGFLAKALGWLGIESGPEETQVGTGGAPEVRMVSRGGRGETKTVQFVPMPPAGGGQTTSARPPLVKAPTIRGAYPNQQYVVLNPGQQQANSSAMPSQRSNAGAPAACLPDAAPPVPRATLTYTIRPSQRENPQEQKLVNSATIPVQVFSEGPYVAERETRTYFPQDQLGLPLACANNNCTDWKKCIDCVNKFI